jgi:nicotinate-nucleotide adenylyltransferase
VAQAALSQLNLDKIVFIPAAQSPLKATTTLASATDRIEMLRLATAGESRFEVDLSEIERGGISYTFDTVYAFHNKHPECPLHWIIGADQFELLPRWHRIEELATLVTFAVLRRPGYSISKTSVPELRHIEIDAPLMPHSSSELRNLLVERRSTEDLLPSSVEAFIFAHGLYTL